MADPTFDGWKVFTYLNHNNDAVVLECVTDDRTPVRMLFEFSPGEARDVAYRIGEQAKAAESHIDRTGRAE